MWISTKIKTNEFIFLVFKILFFLTYFTVKKNNMLSKNIPKKLSTFKYTYKHRLLTFPEDQWNLILQHKHSTMCPDVAKESIITIVAFCLSYGNVNLPSTFIQVGH
jgi:hypothetical protein